MALDLPRLGRRSRSRTLHSKRVRRSWATRTFRAQFCRCNPEGSESCRQDRAKLPGDPVSLMQWNARLASELHPLQVGGISKHAGAARLASEYRAVCWESDECASRQSATIARSGKSRRRQDALLVMEFRFLRIHMWHSIDQCSTRKPSRNFVQSLLPGGCREVAFSVCEMGEGWGGT